MCKKLVSYSHPEGEKNTAIICNIRRRQGFTLLSVRQNHWGVVKNPVVQAHTRANKLKSLSEGCGNR